MIERIEASNFRSFEYLDVALGPFNVLVGANASGKSSFVEVLKFLRDISRHGLLNAISLQGGVKYLRNTTIGWQKPLRICVHLRHEVAVPLLTHKRPRFGFLSDELVYEMQLQFNKKGPNVHAVDDELRLVGRIHRLRSRGRRIAHDPEAADAGEIVIRRGRRGRQVDCQFKGFSSGLTLGPEDLGPWMRRFTLGRSSLLLEWPPLPLVLDPMTANYFGNIGVFDFDPKLPKRAAPITGRRQLEEDGSNLAIVIESVIQTPERRREFTNLVHELLPFVEGFAVEAVADRSLLFLLKEVYAPTKPVPASLMSDGTISVIALVLATYFDVPRPVTVIEEPERNVHPALISGLMEMLRDGASNRQLVVTTHNPEVVRQTKLDELLLASRSESGFTEVSRPADREDVRTFLSREVGLDELFVGNLLGD